MCCHCDFPRGSAAANYIQYLAMAFVSLEYEMLLISNLNYTMLGTERTTSKDGMILYKGIKLIPHELSHIRIIHYLEYHYIQGRLFSQKLKKLNLTANDFVVIYSAHKAINKNILRLKNQIGFKSISCIPELFTAECFPNKREFKQYWDNINENVPHNDVIFPISSYIADFFHKKGCKTFIIPIMADTQEFGVTIESIIKTKTFEKYKFIFPANGMMKDSLDVMLQGLLQLRNEELGKIELHLCGISKKTLSKILPEPELQRLCSIMVVHQWMEYQQLVSLYQQMHFLLLARDVSQMTLANFPSKVPEAMCYGVVPIVSRVGDYTKHYLKDGVNSIIIEKCTPEHCCESIRKALTLTGMEYKNYSANARECAEKQFDFRVWAPRISEILKTL
jgi:glycosyltransferase involved in cell wall biosynthesis